MKSISTFFWRFALQGPCAAISLMAMVYGQTPALQITAPASGTIVPSGQNLSVTVGVAAGTNISGLAVIGEDPIGFSQLLTSPPYQFRLNVPTEIRAGSYSLTAAAAGPSGTELESEPILIDIEPSGAISSLQVQPTTIRFAFVGEQIPLKVIGMVGGAVDLTESSKVTYSSQKTGVASVVAVPATLRGDLNGDGRVDQDDLNIILTSMNTPATKPADARDLNGDGSINALDSRILVTLCGRPGCATH
jgi:hypothetical protein